MGHVTHLCPSFKCLIRVFESQYKVACVWFNITHCAGCVGTKLSCLTCHEETDDFTIIRAFSLSRSHWMLVLYFSCWCYGRYLNFSNNLAFWIRVFRLLGAYIPFQAILKVLCIVSIYGRPGCILLYCVQFLQCNLYLIINLTNLSYFTLWKI